MSTDPEDAVGCGFTALSWLFLLYADLVDERAAKTCQMRKRYDAAKDIGHVGHR